MKSLDFSLLPIEGENVGTYLKSNITLTMMSGIFFATGLSVRDAMHISETLAKSINGKSFLSACFAACLTSIVFSRKAVLIN